MAKKVVTDLTLCVDPGENTGWSIWAGSALVGAGQTPMWDFADDVYARLQWDATHELGRESTPYLADPEQVWVVDAQKDKVALPIKTIVSEDWRLYPDKLKALAWDPCRTARLIGALTMATRYFDLKWFVQPAAIKQTAVNAGAEEFFYRPLHENRHMNDSIMHGVYWNAFGAEGDPRVINRVSKDESKKGRKEN